VKTGVCKRCGATDKKTYLHHLDETLKPKKLFYNGEGNTDLKIRWTKKGFSGSSLYMDWKEKNSDLIYKTIRYYSVGENEVIELCSTCHSEIHKQKGKEKI
jgi:hypothetical protein